MYPLLAWATAAASILFSFFQRVLIIRRRQQHIINMLLMEASESLELDRVFRVAIDQLLSLLAMDGAEVHMLDKTKENLVLAAHKGMPDELLKHTQVVPLTPANTVSARAFHNKGAVYFSNILTSPDSPMRRVAAENGIRSVCCIPLLNKGLPVGTLLFNSRNYKYFSRRHVKMLTDVGRALGMVVANALLYEQVLEEKKHVAVINDFARIVNAHLDIKEVFPAFSEKIHELFCYDNCLIVIPERDKLTIFQLASTGIKRLSDKMSFPIQGSVFEWITENKKPHIVRNLAKEKQFHEDETILASGVRSAIRLPIHNRGEIVGLLILSANECNMYSEVDLDLLIPVTEYLGMSLEKHFLFQKVHKLSQTDELTGLGNKRQLQRELDKELRRAQRYHRELSLLMIDIDHFKNINDNFGHLAGDQVLRELAALVPLHLRDIDLCTRYGGEEFVIILPETGVNGAVSTASKIHSSIERHDFVVESSVHHITVSIGVAVYPFHATNPLELLKSADSALYRAKQEGRNRICVFN
jgi:diguanylate cyclase (GGDEF)-like protein